MITTSIRNIVIVSGLFFALSFGLSFHQALAAEHLTESAFKYQQKMAMLGYANAQYTLAAMYEDGIGTKVNLDKALEWYKKAAVQGHELARQRVDAMANKKRQPSQNGARKSSQQTEKKREQERQEAERKSQQADAQKRSQERAARDNERNQLALERKRLEQERRQLKAEKARLEQERVEQEKLAIEKAERDLARKRAQEAMKKMMAVPDAMEEDE